MTSRFSRIRFQNILSKIYISRISIKKKEILIYIYKKLYFIDDFKIKILINNNIIELKNIIINIVNKKTYINNYKKIVKVFARSRNEFIKKNIYVIFITFIFSYSKILLLIKSINLFTNRDFFSNFLFKRILFFIFI